MPHTRAHSWAAQQDGPRAATTTSSWYSGNAGNNYNNTSVSYGKGGQHHNNNIRKHARTRSLPAITSPAEYLPVPYAKSDSKQQRRPQSFSNGSKMVHMKLADRVGMPAPLWLLPSMPGMTYNPRNELQRRVSPTALSFSSSLSTSTPPLTPITPTSTRSFSASTTTLEDYKRLQFEYPSEEPVYVLTLKTSEEIAQQMQMLRQKWFPADRLKIPAHITLFHALPESQLAQVSSHMDSIALRIKRFEISTGRIVKMKKGVLVNLEAGSDEARHIFVSLRTSWWEWLSEQDKSFKAHWTVQNKEEDQLRVDEAFRDTHRIGAGLGWATGLVLWRYEKNGMWTKAKEVEFAMSGREREPSPQQDSESDGWPVY